MAKTRLQIKLYSLLSLFCLMFLISLGLFYARSNSIVNQLNSSYINQVSDRIIDTLESTFLHLEHVAISLAANEQVHDFLQEQDIMAYHQKAAAIDEILAANYQPDGLVDDILIYDNEGVFYRLRGTLGNTAAERISYLINTDLPSQHVLVNLEGIAYIGYINAISDSLNQNLGYVVFLLKDSSLNRLFSSYDSDQNIQIALVADQKIAASLDSRLLGSDIAQMADSTHSYTIRQIGLSPFQIAVAYDAAINTSQLSFFWMSITIAVLMIVLFIFFYRFLDRLFFRPMLVIMDNVREIGIDSYADTILSETGQQEFDNLVGQINMMIKSLNEQSHALYEIQYQMQDVELKRQLAMIVSLKKQINAHFTVNTLNVIKRLNDIGENEKAGEMCDGLSHLLRYANDGGEYINAWDEMFFLQKYADIMAIRYPERFNIEFDMDDRLADLLIPRMLIQPLIENSIVHGLANVQDGQIKVTAQIANEQIIISVIDNGQGMGFEQLADLHQKIEISATQGWNEVGLEQVALPNIQKRIISLFGNEYGLNIYSEQNLGTTSTITLPIKE